MKVLFSVCFAFVSVLLSVTVKAQSGVIQLYEGNNASQTLVGQITDAPGQYFDLKHKTPYDIGGNDETRSLRLNSVRAGAIISVYDSPSGDPGDDYTVITVKQNVSTIVIGTFESSYEDANVKVEFHHHNGLDGKVSAIRVN